MEPAHVPHAPLFEPEPFVRMPRAAFGRRETASDPLLAKAHAPLHAARMAQMHDVSDPRNASILINVNGELKPRAEAVVSVFDSGFMLGDGVWEGLRVHKGRLAFLDRHLDRLFEGAKAIAMDIGLSREELTKRLYDTLDANGMDEGVHVRLMVTRGVRSTPYQDPRVVISPATIVIIPEYKEPDPSVYERGPQAVHRPCPPRRPGGAGPEAQFALQAELHPRLDPGDAGRAPTRR